MTRICLILALTLTALTADAKPKDGNPLPRKPAPEAKAPEAPPRPVSLALMVPKGGDRVSALVGMAQGFALSGKAGISFAAPQCGGKKYAWGSPLELPMTDVPCECVIENFKTEGCFAVRWTEVEVSVPVGVEKELNYTPAKAP